MSLIKWTPFFEEIEEMEKALRDWQGPSEKSFVPAMDVYEEKGKIIAKTTIADFDPKNIDIEIKDNVLTVKGKTERKTEVDEKNYYRKEIKAGSFQRSVMLPKEVNQDKAEAEYEDGVLKISVPVKKEAKATKKPIKVKINKVKPKKVK